MARGSVVMHGAGPVRTERDGAVDDALPFPEIRAQGLCVDDNVNFCGGLHLPMKRRGLAMASARDSEQALELLRVSSFDVALIDWKLDGSPLDGLELLRRIRSTYHDLPVLFITGFDSKEIETEARQAGADEYLVKDLDTEGLCDIVQALVVTRRRGGAWLALGRRLAQVGVSVSELDESTRTALAKMCTSLGQGLRRADLAKGTGLSLDRFSRRFKRQIGVGWKQFLTGLQVETAQELLRNPSVSVSDVSARVGFGRVKNMERAFHNLIGLTPTEFREQSRCS